MNSLNEIINLNVSKNIKYVSRETFIRIGHTESVKGALDFIGFSCVSNFLNFKYVSRETFIRIGHTESVKGALDFIGFSCVSNLCNKEQYMSSF